MPAPSPTSPTLADLMYNAYDPGGSIRTTAYVPILSANVNDNVRTSENMVPNLAGFTGSVDVSDVTSTVQDGTEIGLSVGPTGPTLITQTVSVSDTATSAEALVMDKVGFTFQVNVSDSTATSENTAVSTPA